jgi:hypothetical protein
MLEPVAVRYAWRHWFVGLLRGTNMLLGSSFRIDKSDTATCNTKYIYEIENANSNKYLLCDFESARQTLVEQTRLQKCNAGVCMIVYEDNILSIKRFYNF